MLSTSKIAPASAARLIGPDGPYARFEQNRLELIYVNESGNLVKESRSLKLSSVACKVDGYNSFMVSIQMPAQSEWPESEHPGSSLIAVISDIEGNFNAFYNLLVSNKIMNAKFEWTFGLNDLVILGDATDKGPNITQCLWLIYHLEHQALLQGGKVHYLLGNHELMNLSLDIRYVPDKYLTLAKRISSEGDAKEAYRALLAHNSILIDWLKKRNCIEKIDDNLFVHAGISPEFLDQELSIQQTNSILHQYLNFESFDPSLAGAVVGGLGPMWYRGLVRESAREELYHKVDETFIDQVLEYYGVRRVVIGHTLVDHVSADYHGKVWRVDFLHSQERPSKKSEALLIDGDTLFRINGGGGKRLLQKSHPKMIESKKRGRLVSLFINNHTP